MVKQSYVPLANPKAEFEKLRPAVDVLDAMKRHYKPFSQEYLILMAARDGITTAAFHFTREPYMFGAAPPSA